MTCRGIGGHFLTSAVGINVGIVCIDNETVVDGSGATQNRRDVLDAPRWRWVRGRSSNLRGSSLSSRSSRISSCGCLFQGTRRLAGGQRTATRQRLRPRGRASSTNRAGARSLDGLGAAKEVPAHRVWVGAESRGNGRRVDERARHGANRRRLGKRHGVGGRG